MTLGPKGIANLRLLPTDSLIAGNVLSSGLVAENFGDGVQENPFSVSTWAVDEKQGMLPDISGQAIARHLLHEPDQIGVALGGLVQERQP